MHLLPERSTENLLLVDIPPEPRWAATWWAKRAANNYATYRVTNATRHQDQLSQAEAARALKEAIYEAVRRHKSAYTLVT